jgi:hypothetical protein
MKPLDYLTLENIEILRQRVLEVEEDDDSRDEEINDLTKEEIASALVGWELGSESWLDWMIDTLAESTDRHYDEMKELIFEEK